VIRSILSKEWWETGQSVLPGQRRVDPVTA
jgi:hypothetical protein